MSDMEIIIVFFVALASLIVIPAIAADICCKYDKKKD